MLLLAPLPIYNHQKHPIPGNYHQRSFRTHQLKRIQHQNVKKQIIDLSCLVIPSSSPSFDNHTHNITCIIPTHYVHNFIRYFFYIFTKRKTKFCTTPTCFWSSNMNCMVQLNLNSQFVVTYIPLPNFFLFIHIYYLEY